MKRFVIFPLIMGIAGALFPISVWLIATSLYLPAIARFNVMLWSQFLFPFLDVVNFGCLYGFSVGLVLGIVLSCWDIFRNCRSEKAYSRLLANIMWFGCYAILINLMNAISNALALFLFANRATPADWILMTPIFGVALINFAAILWAAIRSITTDDILTPHVLRDKLRERSRLH